MNPPDTEIAEAGHLRPRKAVTGAKLAAMTVFYRLCRDVATESEILWFGLNAVNPGAHEPGHVAFSFPGEFMMMLGGTLGQLTPFPYSSASDSGSSATPSASRLPGRVLLSELLRHCDLQADARELRRPLVTIGGQELLVRSRPALPPGRLRADHVGGLPRCDGARGRPDRDRRLDRLGHPPPAGVRPESPAELPENPKYP